MLGCSASRLCSPTHNDAFIFAKVLEQVVVLAMQQPPICKPPRRMPFAYQHAAILQADDHVEIIQLDVETAAIHEHRIVMRVPLGAKKADCTVVFAFEVLYAEHRAFTEINLDAFVTAPQCRQANFPAQLVDKIEIVAHRFCHRFFELMV
jgi:hypothetical protein